MKVNNENKKKQTNKQHTGIKYLQITYLTVDLYSEYVVDPERIGLNCEGLLICVCFSINLYSGTI